MNELIESGEEVETPEETPEETPASKEKHLFRMIEKVGIPVVYHHWEVGNSPDPPFIVYLFTSSDNLAADNKVYHNVNNYQVELYVDKKDVALEKSIEAVFDENEVFYEKAEIYIEGQKLYEVQYFITL